MIDKTNNQVLEIMQDKENDIYPAIGKMGTRINNKDKEVLILLQEGLTQTEIAKKMNVSRQYISARIIRMKEKGINIPESKKSIDSKDQVILRLLKEGLTQREISKQLNLGDSVISTRIKKMKEKGIKIPNKKYKINNKEKETLILLEEGLSQTEIAKKFKVSQVAISLRIKKMKEKGLEIPETKRKLKVSEQDLARAIVNLIKTKHATLEQIQVIADYYQVDLTKTLNSLEER